MDKWNIGVGPWDIFLVEDRFSFGLGIPEKKVLNMVLKFHPSFQGLGSKAISILPSDAFSFYPKYKAALLYLQYFCNFFANQNLDYPKDNKCISLQVYSKLTSKSVFDFFEILGWFDEDIFLFLSCMICFALIGWSSSESVCSPRNPVQSSSLSDILKRLHKELHFK